MEYITKGMEPRLPLQYFEEISAIPRGSYNEAAVAEYVRRTAERLGLFVIKDERDNVFVRKPATPGFEHLPSILMQAHMDMVCEKNADSDHDFLKDPLDLYIEDGFLKARGTTLGCDDGYGVVYMLSLMDEDGDTFPHPEMEFLFTVQEEVTFYGAFGFDYSQVHSRRMIGMDAGPEGVTTLTSAGVQEIKMYIDQEWEEYTGEALKIDINGLLGGHSAACITFELGNSNKIMGRLLHNVEKVADYRICHINGGLQFNAIPREATATIAILDGNKEKAIEVLNEQFRRIKAELEPSDPGVAMTLTDVTRDKMLSKKVTKAVVDTMYNVPNGVRMMNVQIPGLPVTSTNMGIVRFDGDRVFIDTMMRSSSTTVRDDFMDNITEIAKMCGMTDFVYGNWLPAWPYMANSPMRNLVKKLYLEKYGVEMKEEATHGGLELGTFSENIPGLDITVFGPNAYDCHTVTERVEIESFGRVYQFLKDVLAELTKE